jgi:hypothetical protein
VFWSSRCTALTLRGWLKWISAEVLHCTPPSLSLPPLRVKYSSVDVLHDGMVAGEPVTLCTYVRGGAYDGTESVTKGGASGLCPHLPPTSNRPPHTSSYACKHLWNASPAAGDTRVRVPRMGPSAHTMELCVLAHPRARVQYTQ